MSFLVLWSICWSSLINIKNGLEYLTRGDNQGIFPFDEISAFEDCHQKRFRFVCFLFLFFFFFFDYHYVWSSCRDYMICLYLKIPKNFVRLILLDGFWVLHLAFVRIVKFWLFSQFPVDHLAHPVVSSLFTSLMPSRIMWLIVRLSHHVIYICYCVVSCLFLFWHSPDGVILCCCKKRFCFSLKVSLSWPCPILIM